MIGKIRNSTFTKFFWGFMGLYLLNISVDTSDPNPNNIPEDLSINDQESIVEIVVEKILGYDDAFEEYDDPDTEDHNKKSHVKIDLLVHLNDEYKSPYLLFLQKRPPFPELNKGLAHGFGKIDGPPPKI